MTAADLAVNLVLSAFLIVGAYQLYFWCQRNATRPSRELGLGIDHRIPYRPGWVWIYSFLYYPVILYVNLVLQTPAEFTRVAFSFMMLLAFQVVCFLGFPVTTPERWRSLNARRNGSERFLAFVQKFDARSNSFPSMHTSVATLAALHLHPHVGAWAWCFPVLIGLSCLFTKQHYVVDVPAGAALGWGTFGVYRAIL